MSLSLEVNLENVYRSTKKETVESKRVLSRARERIQMKDKRGG